MKLEDVVITFLHWLRDWKDWVSRNILLGKYLGDRAERRGWPVDRTLAFRWEGMVIGLLDRRRCLALIRVADPSVVHVHDWLIQLLCCT